MKTPLFPLSNWSQPTSETFDLEDSDDIIGVARHLIDGNHPGVLTTVDEKGRPHARWMATLGFDTFPVFHTLTSPHSSKIRQIELNPNLNWMFSNQDLSLIVNIIGLGKMITDTSSMKRIWKSIEDKSHAYFLNNFTEAPGFAVLETTVTEIMCSIPKSSLMWSMDLASFPQVKKAHEIVSQPVHR